METLSGFPSNVVAFVWHDDMSADEFRNALTRPTPAASSHKHDIRLFAKLAEDRSKNPGARSLDDAMLGSGNWRDFGRIAIVTDETWVRHIVQFFAPFVHGPIRIFSNLQSADARRWLMRRDLN